MGEWFLSRRDSTIVAWHEYVFSAYLQARGRLIRGPKWPR